MFGASEGSLSSQPQFKSGRLCTTKPRVHHVNVFIREMEDRPRNKARPCLTATTL